MYMYALNFDNMYLWRTCKRLGPARVRRSKYLFLLCRRQSCHSVTGIEMIDFFRLKGCVCWMHVEDDLVNDVCSAVRG